jgi:hypothetical protein
VFTAAGLAPPDQLDEAAMSRVREESSPESSQVTSSAAPWGEYEIATESIEDVREEFAMSFGSCSFDEPRQDLRAIGLL